MRKPIKITPEQKVRRGEGTAYVIDNYITSEFSEKVSLAISHLKGELWPTRNKVSDRIYYFIRGKAHFVFEDETELDVKQGDVLLVPAGSGYKMNGNFDAVLVNSPPFNPTNEEEIEL
jgi:mannose-6-phosphate isomerase-like protein (cupin superfamily)